MITFSRKCPLGMLYHVVVTFNLVDETLVWCDRSTERVLSFISCHRKYSQSECMKALVHSSVLHPILPSCTALMLHLLCGRCVFDGMSNPTCPLYFPGIYRSFYTEKIQERYSTLYHSKALHN